jgi:hypothetical protein
MYPKVNFQGYFALLFEFSLALIGILAACSSHTCPLLFFFRCPCTEYQHFAGRRSVGLRCKHYAVALISTWTGPHVGYRPLNFLLPNHHPTPLQMSGHARARSHGRQFRCKHYAVALISTWTGPHVGDRPLNFLLQMSGHAPQYEDKSQYEDKFPQSWSRVRQCAEQFYLTLHQVHQLLGSK